MSNIKSKVQGFGKFLSGMVMPNIGAFIAWGLITAFFIPSGWFPNETFSQLVSPIQKYLLPILIGFSGGKAVAGIRGGVMGAIATSGVIVGSDIPMFIGAMIVGPLSGYVIKKFDKMVEGKIPSGFEMFINNFSIGILGMIFAIISLMLVGPVIATITGFLSKGVAFIISKGLLPFVSIFIEPGKVLFLNNAINHGILGPIGIDQTINLGKSVLFLLESNPGPGLGVILAYYFFSKGSVKQSTPSAAVIHFLGGIHEIYFPYILMSPILIVAVIIGSFAGIFLFSFFSVGLVASPSPGSIFSILALSAKGDHLKIILGILVSTVVTFVLSGFFIRKNSDKFEESFNQAKDKMQNLKYTKIENVGDIKRIVFACDAGMGSSAMGASKFKNRLKKVGIDIFVSYSSVDNIKEDAQVIVTHKDLVNRVNIKNVRIVPIQNFLNDSNIENLFNDIVSSRSVVTKDKDSKEEVLLFEESIEVQSTVFNEKNIVLDAKVSSKEEAIKKAGELLFKNGYVEEQYIEGMLLREKSISTYIGMGVAIPHGETKFKDCIKRSGVVLLQVKEGVDFGEDKAYLIFGIAGVGDEHLKILSNIATVIEDEVIVKELITSSDKKEIINIILKSID